LALEVPLRRAREADALARYPAKSRSPTPANAEMRLGSNWPKHRSDGRAQGEKTAVIVATEYTFEKIAEQWLGHWRGTRAPVTRRPPETGSGRTFTPFLGRAPSPILSRLSWSSWQGNETRGASDHGKRILQIVGMVLALRRRARLQQTEPGIRNSSVGHSQAYSQKEHGRIDAREFAPLFLRSIELYQGTTFDPASNEMMALTFCPDQRLIWRPDGRSFDLEAISLDDSGRADEDEDAAPLSPFPGRRWRFLSF